MAKNIGHIPIRWLNYKWWTRKTFIIFLILLLILLTFFNFNWNIIKNGENMDKENNIETDLDDEKTIEQFNYTKIPILNIFYQDFLPELEKEISHCPNKIRIVRNEKNNDFDAALISFYDLEYLVNMQKSNKEKKLLIIISLESPLIMSDITSAKKHFNVLIGSYLKKSSIYLPYGICYKKLFWDIIDWNKIHREFNTRKSMGLAIISNCEKNTTNRLQYIEILNKFFKIQTFGSCFGNRITQEKKIEEIKKYKFFLSFENCNCEGYITEKFFEPLKYGAIPVVMGGKDYSSVAIPGTYINARDYSSPAKLGEYLNYVSTNYYEYIKYFSYTDTRECILPDRSLWFDDICDFNQLILNSVYNHYKYDPAVDMISNKSRCFMDEAL